MVLGHGKELVRGNLELCVLHNFKEYYNEPNVLVHVAACARQNGYRPWGPFSCRTISRSEAFKCWCAPMQREIEAIIDRLDKLTRLVQG